MKLRVNWAPDRLLTLEQILGKPGYYLNAVSGDIFFNDGNAPREAFEGAPRIEEAMAAGTAPTEVDPRIWLLVTDDLDLTEAEVRGMLRDAFQVRMEEQGRFVGRQVWRRT